MPILNRRKTSRIGTTYFVFTGGESQGPYDLPFIEAMVLSDMVPPTVSVSTDGKTGWKELSTLVPGLAPPPLPPPVPPQAQVAPESKGKNPNIGGLVVAAIVGVVVIVLVLASLGGAHPQPAYQPSVATQPDATEQSATPAASDSSTAATDTQSSQPRVVIPPSYQQPPPTVTPTPPPVVPSAEDTATAPQPSSSSPVNPATGTVTNPNLATTQDSSSSAPQSTDSSATTVQNAVAQAAAVAPSVAPSPTPQDNSAAGAPAQDSTQTATTPATQDATTSSAATQDSTTTTPQATPAAYQQAVTPPPVAPVYQMVDNTGRKYRVSQGAYNVLTQQEVQLSTLMDSINRLKTWRTRASSQIDTDRAYLDNTDQDAVDRFNREVTQYNDSGDTLDKEIDQYNAGVDAHNDYLIKVGTPEN